MKYYVFSWVLLTIGAAAVYLLFRRKRRHRPNVSHLADDILKYMFDCEYRSAPCRLDSLSGHLNLPSQYTAKGIEQLIEEGMLSSTNDHRFVLTDKGRTRALSIIRKHRLIERYLADETGTLPEHWHAKADHFEHYISDSEIDNIIRRTGHPLYDPHGDPIPTSSGEIPPKVKEFSLLDMKKGQCATINHVEDEPASIFYQLSQMGIHPGLHICLTDKSHGQYTITSHLGDSVVTPIQAGAINIKPEGDAPILFNDTSTLDTVPTGQTMRIQGLSKGLRGRQRRRLLDLGFVPGNRVTPVLANSNKNPRAYEILNTLIALRTEQASKILVTPITNNTEEE